MYETCESPADPPHQRGHNAARLRKSLLLRRIARGAAVVGLATGLMYLENCETTADARDARRIYAEYIGGKCLQGTVFDTENAPPPVIETHVNGDGTAFFNLGATTELRVQPQGETQELAFRYAAGSLHPDSPQTAQLYRQQECSQPVAP